VLAAVAARTASQDSALKKDPNSIPNLEKNLDPSPDFEKKVASTLGV